MKYLLRLLIVLILSGMPVYAQDTPAIPANLTDSCVTDFDAATDYFPDKADIIDAQNLTVDYFNNYKVVTVTGSMETYTYVLVQCGTPAPDASDFPEATQFVEVPTDNLISLSTTFLPGIAQLGLAQHVVGMDNTLYTSTPEIIERIDSGDIIAVAPNFELNIELLLETEAAIVMSDDFDSERMNTILDAGIVTAINTDYLEATPLGRAEWLKYVALFYNQEAAAEALYTGIFEDYGAAVELASTVAVDARPTVLWNAISPFSDSWGIPGENTYAGSLIIDAGGMIALADAQQPASVAYVSLETVYDGALDADIWITNLFNVRTIDELLAIDERYADFAAVQNGTVWNNDLDVNENGGNNYFELGVTNPHLVLLDLIAIFHPDLLPEHEFRFYQPLSD